MEGQSSSLAHSHLQGEWSARGEISSGCGQQCIMITEMAVIKPNLHPTHLTYTPHISPIPHTSHQYPTHLTNTPHISPIPHTSHQHPTHLTIICYPNSHPHSLYLPPPLIVPPTPTHCTSHPHSSYLPPPLIVPPTPTHCTSHPHSSHTSPPDTPHLT